MDLRDKPLYALRDLATRLGVKAPTVYTKTVLLQKIDERKTEIEEHKPTPKFNNLGRPRLNNCHIGINEDENGKITFYESETPLTENKNYEVKPEDVIKVVSPPAVEDEPSREKLEKAKEILDLLSFAIQTVLDR